MIEKSKYNFDEDGCCDWRFEIKMRIFELSYNASGPYMDCPTCHAKSKYQLICSLRRNSSHARCNKCKSSISFFSKTALKNNKIDLLSIFILNFMLKNGYLKQLEIMDLFSVGGVTASRLRRICKEIDNDFVLIKVFNESYLEIDGYIRDFYPYLYKKFILSENRYQTDDSKQGVEREAV